MMAGATDGRAVSHTGMEWRLLGSPEALLAEVLGKLFKRWITTP